jgi:hypothetical protein
MSRNQFKRQNLCFRKEAALNKNKIVFNEKVECRMNWYNRKKKPKGLLSHGLVVESWGNYYVLAFHFQMKEGARSSCEHE